MINACKRCGDAAGITQVAGSDIYRETERAVGFSDYHTAVNIAADIQCDGVTYAGFAANRTRYGDEISKQLGRIEDVVSCDGINVDRYNWCGCVENYIGRVVRVCTADLFNTLTCKAKPRRLKTNRRIKPLASFIQQYKTVATASCAAGIASRTWAGCGCFEVCGGVKASSEGLFQVGVWGVFTYVVLLGFRRCLPPAVLPHGDDFAIRYLQSHFAAQACQDLLTLEQALAFKYLALDAVEGNGENLTNKAFNDGDESAHKSGSELGA